jgi:hypothetical protein
MVARREDEPVRLSLLAAALAAAVPAGALARNAPPGTAHRGTILVSNFEDGLAGWWTNDRVRFENRNSGPTPLISIALSDQAHSGKHSLEIDFHPGNGWANAAINPQDVGDLWADARVDEIRLWLKGDGSSKPVRIGLQCWKDDLRSPCMFETPVSLRDTAWHEVVIPLSKLQATLPNTPLRLRSLISLQVDGSGELAPARLWIDDVRVAAARGEGARYAAGPLDAQVQRRPPAHGLPRLGNWAYPGSDPDALRKCLALGIGFSSNEDASLRQQSVFIHGIVTNESTGRPSGADLIAGLGLTDADMDQDAQGRRTGEGVESAVFHPSALTRFREFVRRKVRSRRNAPWVSSFMLSSPISMYGEAHYPASTAGQYAVFSRPAKTNFRNWLKRVYRGDLQAVAHAWGRPIGAWDEILPPDGQIADASGIDRRRWWSDFIHWYVDWLDTITRDSIAAARSETGKPIATMLGGPKIGLSQGIQLGNIGPMVRMLGAKPPAFFSDTDSQTLFSCRYSRAACSQYGVELMVEHVGPPYLTPFHQYDMALNVLACGADHAHLATLGELFDPNHWFSRLWTDLAPIVLKYRTGYVKSDAAMFHSYVTSWYRPSRSNGDCVSLYDSTNTLWFWNRGYPSWGRALGSPDIVDDAMVEDGGLAGRKLLVVPNSGVTVTTRKALDAIRSWVRSGGSLVAFGPGALAFTVEENRSVTATPGLGGLIPQAELTKALASHKIGDRAKLERRVGAGRVTLYLTPADPAIPGASGRPFVHEAMDLLSVQAKAAGVRIWCRASPGYDANLMYCGRDRISHRHLFALDMTEKDRPAPQWPQFWSNRTFDLSFNPSLSGDAELVSFTDSFSSCRGGKAAFDARTRTLKIRFRLPGKLTIRLGTLASVSASTSKPSERPFKLVSGETRERSSTNTKRGP